jgi:anti-sigma factor RsiW
MALNGESHLSPAELADLSALADGRLDPGRRDAVEAWIRSSPDLRDLYERERRAVEPLQQRVAGGASVLARQFGARARSRPH